MKYKAYQIKWGCGCTGTTVKTIAEVYDLAKVLGIPRRIVGLNNVMSGFVLQIVKDNSKRGWSVEL